MSANAVEGFDGMISEIIEDIFAVRHNAGAWQRADHTFVRITGADAATWLHSQTTNDVTGLESGQGHANAILDRQGRLQGHFTLHRWEDEYWMLVERGQWPHIHEHLDAHLFIENVQMQDAGEELEQVVIQGPRTLRYLAQLLDRDGVEASHLLPSAPWGCHPLELAGFEVLAFRVSLTGEDGYVFVVEHGQGGPLLDALIAGGGNAPVPRIRDEAIEVLRIEAGIPTFGVDMDATNPIPETTLERTAVSYEKGCYIGQEVVARLRTYGSVKQALVGLVLEGPCIDHVMGEVLVDGPKRVGRITSRTYSPTLDAEVALAYMDREHRASGEVYELRAEGSGIPIRVRVRALPLYDAPDRAAHARALYEEALGLFETDLEDEDVSAIPLLKEAVSLDPKFEDAYEALGVILNRHQRVDEAIHYMLRLAALNPNCLMAHTNLSVFYVAKGMIAEAEEEKAKAAVLGIQRAADERRAKEMAEAERMRLELEARQRIEMFAEVLEIDPEDPVATFGTGKAHMQLNQYAEAIPFFERAAETQNDYSAAWLSLGKCHEFLGETEAATQAYRHGIDAASRKGDLMPLREMERRLNALGSAAGVRAATE